MAGAQKKKRRRSRHQGDPERAEIAARREEARRRAREERRAAALAEEQRTRRRKSVRRIVVWTAGGAALIAVGLLVFRPAPEVEGVDTPDELDTRILAAGEAFEYPSSTPTSGPYRDEDPVCGVFPDQIDPEAAVTALYYGAVVVWHDPDLPASELSVLSGLAADAETHVVVSPNTGLDAPIVATAWNRLKTYERADAAADFIETYRTRGPESADCPVS